MSNLHNSLLCHELPRLSPVSITKHFIDIGEKFTLTELEIAGPNQLKVALEPLKWATNKITRHGSTILTAEAVFKTTIGNFGSIEHSYCKRNTSFIYKQDQSNVDLVMEVT